MLLVPLAAETVAPSTSFFGTSFLLSGILAPLTIAQSCLLILVPSIIVFINFLKSFSPPELGHLLHEHTSDLHMFL